MRGNKIMLPGNSGKNHVVNLSTLMIIVNQLSLNTRQYLDVVFIAFR